MTDIDTELQGIQKSLDIIAKEFQKMSLSLTRISQKRYHTVSSVLGVVASLACVSMFVQHTIITTNSYIRASQLIYVLHAELFVYQFPTPKPLTRPARQRLSQFAARISREITCTIPSICSNMYPISLFNLTVRHSLMMRTVFSTVGFSDLTRKRIDKDNRRCLRFLVPSNNIA
jgi:hypothetical protein